MNYLPMEKLNFNLSFVYTDSRGHIMNFQLDGPVTANELKYSNYYNYDFSMVPSYSDLDIRTYDLIFTSSYKIRNNLSLGIQYNYRYYEDKKPYLGTPENPYKNSGQAHIGWIGINYKF